MPLLVMHSSIVSCTAKGLIYAFNDIVIVCTCTLEYSHHAKIKVHPETSFYFFGHCLFYSFQVFSSKVYLVRVHSLG